METIFYRLAIKVISWAEWHRRYEDFLRGVSYVDRCLRRLPEKVFFEAESLRIQYRLMTIDKKLLSAYRRLGQRAFEGLTDQAPLLAEEEMEELFGQIATILEERQWVEAEREALHARAYKKTEERIF